MNGSQPVVSGGSASSSDVARARAVLGAAEVQLANVRSAAARWQAGLVGLAGGITAFSLISGREEIASLASGWAAWCGVAVGLALAASVAGGCWRCAPPSGCRRWCVPAAGIRRRFGELDRARPVRRRVPADTGDPEEQLEVADDGNVVLLSDARPHSTLSPSGPEPARHGRRACPGGMPARTARPRRRADRIRGGHSPNPFASAIRIDEAAALPSPAVCVVRSAPAALRPTPIPSRHVIHFDPTRFQIEPAACYRASWHLPGPDFRRQATTSSR